MKRIGVFVCHCGLNIADIVDVKKVVEAISKHPGVVHAVDYTYMCSDPGQEMIKSAILDKNWMVLLSQLAPLHFMKPLLEIQSPLQV